MKCPYCKRTKDRVIDSRTTADGATIRRRRECLECARRYTTYEKVEEVPFRVIKKDGVREPFDREKILRGLMTACEKRSVPTERLVAIVDAIEASINEMFDKEVASKFIGNLVLAELRPIDQVAYVRFASVYREFKDIKEFLSELEEMRREGEEHDGEA
jgi:transcriptional repressor NrdR